MENMRENGPGGGVDPARAAMIIVDMQNDFADTSGVLAKEGKNLDRVRAVIPEIRKMLDFFRENGLNVVHVITHHLGHTTSEVWNSRPGNRNSSVGKCIPGTRGAEVVEPLRPAGGEPVVVKHRFDAFLNTDLDLILRALGVTHIFIAGTKTNVCVDTTARSGFMRDYHTAIVSNCVASDDESLHGFALENFRSAFGAVMTSGEVIRRLGRGPGS